MMKPTMRTITTRNPNNTGCLLIATSFATLLIASKPLQPEDPHHLIHPLRVETKVFEIFGYEGKLEGPHIPLEYDV